MTDTTAPPDADSPKVDPETLVLRASPVRATRFRRGVIVAIGGAGATLIAGAAWLALKPVSLGSMTPGDDRAVAAKPPSDALAGAPSSYGDIPKLGAPLPGDLGRPILEKQREMDMAMPTDPAAEAAARAAQEAEAERQRLAAEKRTARESGVMLQMTNAAAGPAAYAGLLPAPPVAEAAPSGTGADPNGQMRKNELVGRANGRGDANPHQLEAPTSPWTLQAGSIIAGSLITGLNSDVPGIVTAQVTENAYDSVTGRTLLIPQGSRLIGSYDSVVAFGQNRALVVWQRVILPDGASIRIDNVPASDTQGYAGLSDRVDRHTWQLLKGVALSTLLGVGTELGWGSSESDLVRAVRESTQQNGARAGDQLVARNLDVQPTLKVRPGWPLRIVVHKDLVLKPWRR
ncbi:Conjugation TrbI family protein [Novosphingobium resinovorum]|uniref:Conjugation TrbI family protein n=1 Tax=Novosphingobium resinovorum TaxID=158500 RepID=A0A031JZF0_9SPHN|nr:MULTISPECIES: TrbI/VirB10 family protein [Novosphingobium]EZP83126.1 Conjugation TrbI family protein [Novosphingobium resinovorum]